MDSIIEIWFSSNTFGRWGAVMDLILAAVNVWAGWHFANLFSILNYLVAVGLVCLAWFTVLIGARRRPYFAIENWLLRAAQRRAEREES